MPPNDERIPFRQAEISVRRFNEEAVPHHLGLLKNHRSNIEKSLALGDWSKVQKEEINAKRVIKQYKNLLLEMNALREKVRDEDLERFDALLELGKAKALDGLREYMELQLKSPTSTINSRLTDEDEEQIVRSPAEIGNTMAHQQSLAEIESAFQSQEYQLAQREACLTELEHLQGEIYALNGMFGHMREMVQEQAVSVQVIADNAEEALENVQLGEANLRRALTYKKAMYPVLGAFLGTCVGGPIGLIAGLKAGSLAAVGCGILGFTGGSVLKSTTPVMQGNIHETQPEQLKEELEMEKKTE